MSFCILLRAAMPNYNKPWLQNLPSHVTGNSPGRRSGGAAKPRGGAAAAGNNNGGDSEFMLSVYPNGDGPDSDLIRTLERDVIDKNPQVKFEDIAELDEAKKILQEAVLLPILMP